MREEVGKKEKISHEYGKGGDDDDSWVIAGGSSGGSAVSVAVGTSFAWVRRNWFKLIPFLIAGYWSIHCLMLVDGVMLLWCSSCECVNVMFLLWMH